MEHSLVRNWWVVLLRGVLAILFGVMVLIWPLLGLVLMVASFGAYALLDGIFAIGAAFSSHGRGHAWALLLEGVVGIAAGVLTFFWPVVTGVALLMFIGVWAIATGVFEIIAAFRLRRAVAGEWMLALSGVLSVAFGLVLVFLPGVGALAVAWLIAAYALLFGVLMVGLAFQLRGFARRTPLITR
jgi:uncharacterized membrane protein HdeD (DUF308 family)